MMTTFIYALKDPRDGAMRYVGKSNAPSIRRRHHYATRAGLHNSIKAAWLRGLVAAGFKPEVVILEECPRLVWQDRERYWIKTLRSNGSLLVNISTGGNGLSEATQDMGRHRSERMRGRFLSEEHKAKIAAAHRGKKRPPFSDEWRQHIAEAHRCLVQSEATRLKRSQSLKGRNKPPLTPDHRAKISAANRGRWIGRTVSLEQRQKIRVALRGRTLSQEHRDKIGQAGLGRKFSEVSIEKMRAARRAWHSKKQDAVFTAPTS